MLLYGTIWFYIFIIVYESLVTFLIQSLRLDLFYTFQAVMRLI